MTDAIEEGDMTFDGEQSTERTVEADATDVELESAADVVEDDDVEAHVWRAQS